jgi:hypothetical protein
MHWEVGREGAERGPLVGERLDVGVSHGTGRTKSVPAGGPQTESELGTLMLDRRIGGLRWDVRPLLLVANGQMVKS